MMKKENNNNNNNNNLNNNDADTLSTTTSSASLHSVDCLTSLQPLLAINLDEQKENGNDDEDNEKNEKIGNEIEFKCDEINTVQALGSLLLSLFKDNNTTTTTITTTTKKKKKNKCIESILMNTNFSTNELNRFLFWSSEKPYTRNCVIHNDNFTALLLCWVLSLIIITIIIIILKHH